MSERSEALADADGAAEALLLLYEALGITAMVVTYTGDAIVVRCQDSEDVVPLCQRVLREHEVPDSRTVN